MVRLLLNGALFFACSAWIATVQVPAGSGLGSLRYSADGSHGQLFQERHPADPDQY